MRFTLNVYGRDSQRGRVYRAERMAYNTLIKMGIDLHSSVSTPDLYRRKVNEVMASDWMRQNFPRAVAAGPVGVEFSNRKGGANANERRIRTGTKSQFIMSLQVLLHELSHTLVRREYGLWMYHCRDRGTLHRESTGLSNYGRHHIAGHGPEYADVYARLVREFIGYQAWQQLCVEFDARRVKRCAPHQYSAAPQRQFGMGLAYARTAPRSTNPSVRAAVRVNGQYYKSVHDAFVTLGLPINAHQKFRAELKQAGAKTFVTSDGRQFQFITIAK